MGVETPALLLRALLIWSLLLLAGCSSGDKKEGAQPVPVGPETGVGDQKVQLVRAAPQRSDGKAVLVDTVAFGAGKGYVVIHEDGNGAPGKVIGASGLLGTGEHKGVLVPVDPPLAAGKVKVWPVVHLEDNGNERFDYPAADQPASIDGTGVVVVPIEITVT